MFTRKDILREIRESTSKVIIYRKPKIKIFMEPKNYPTKKLILARS